MEIHPDDYTSTTIAEMIKELEIDPRLNALRGNTLLPWANLVEAIATHLVMTDTVWTPLNLNGKKMKTYYYELTSEAKESLKNELSHFVKEDYLTDNYIDLTFEEIIDSERFSNLEERIELVSNSIEIPKLETKSGNPELIFLNEKMFLRHEDL